MTHEEAIRLMASEGYLLNELSPEEKDAFEEHYFSCAECAIDVQVTAAFLDQVKAELPRFAAPAVSPANVTTAPQKARGWAWSPAWVGALACLLLISVGFNLKQRRDLTHASAAVELPQLLPSVSLLGSNARGGSIPTVRVHGDRPFLLSVDVPGDSRYRSYTAALYAPSGEQLWSLVIPSEAASDTLPLQVFPPKRDSGLYVLKVQGVAQDNSSTTLEELPFRLEQQN